MLDANFVRDNLEAVTTAINGVGGTLESFYFAFGEPIDTGALDPDGAEDPMLVFNLTDQVRETIQQTLYRLLLQRRSVFR